MSCPAVHLVSVVCELSGCAARDLVYVSSVVQNVCCERFVVCELLSSCVLGDLLYVSCPAVQFGISSM